MAWPEGKILQKFLCHKFHNLIKKISRKKIIRLSSFNVRNHVFIEINKTGELNLWIFYLQMRNLEFRNIHQVFSSVGSVINRKEDELMATIIRAYSRTIISSNEGRFTVHP